MEQVVWVPEPKEGFVLATIVDLGMDEVTVQPMAASKARFTLPLDRVYTADPHFDNKDVDDNCKYIFHSYSPRYLIVQIQNEELIVYYITVNLQVLLCI